MPNRLPEEGPPLVPLRSYSTLAAARGAALVLAAREWVHEIDREDEIWVLLVEEPHWPAAREELALFEAEQAEPAPVPPARELGDASPFSLFLVAMLLMAAFVAQDRFAPRFTEAGEADNGAILAGQWWRCFTALTLHADGTHLAANLATGALFAGFLTPQLGAGWTWLMVLAGGGLGNLINAWGYRGTPHHSLGASTAVFAALGLLVAGEARFRRQAETRPGWKILVPIGGGLALLAFLGVGEKQDTIDFMAHWWGFCSGLALGIPAMRLRPRITPFWQALAGVAALALLAGSWWLAWRAG